MNGNCSQLSHKVKKSKVVPVLNKLSTTLWRRVTNGGIAPPILISALEAGEWLTPGEEAHDIHCIWEWVGLRADLDAVEVKPCLESNPGFTARRYTDWAIAAYSQLSDTV
jgi:hypothetical protein